MDFFDYIATKYSKIIRSRCHENRCELKVYDFQKCIILDGDQITNEKSSDCIIFVETNEKFCIVIAELKSKNPKADEVIAKLQNSTEVALRIINEYCNKGLKYKFYHLVLCKSWPHVSEYQRIKNRKIKVGGKQFSIFPTKCGYPLSRLIPAS